MRSAASIAVLALLASPVFAAPLAAAERRSVAKAVAARVTTEEPEEPAPASSEPSVGSQLAGAAVGGAASATVSNLLNKIESLFRREDFDGEFAKRDVSALPDILKAVPSLSAADKQTVKTALINKISTLQNVSSRSVGGDLAGAAVGGASSALVGNLLGEIEKFFKRHEVELEARAPLSLSGGKTSTTSSSGGTGTAILGSAVGGATSAVVGNLLNQIESLFRRDDELTAKRDVSALTDILKAVPSLSPADKQTVKTALVNKISTLQGSTSSKRSLAGDLAGSAVGGASSAVVGNLLSEIEKFFKRDEFELEARAPLSLGKTSTSSSGGTGTALLSSAAGGAASGLVGNLLGEIENLFRRDDFELEARAPLSLSGGKTSTSSSGGTGTAILGSAVGGATSAVVGNLLNQIESLFRRDDELTAKRDVSALTDILKAVPSLSATDKQTVKTALINKISTLQGSTSSKRGLAGDLAGSAVGGASSAVVGNLLSEIEKFFKRDDFELEARAPLSLGGKTSTSSGGTGTALLGSAVGGAASGLVGNLLGQIENLFRRDDFELEARAPLSLSGGKTSTSSGGTGTAILGSAVGGASSAVVGNLLNQIESLFRRDDEGSVKRDVSALTDILKAVPSLSPTDKQTVKTALVNKISTLQGSSSSKRGIVTSSVGGLTSVATNHAVGDLLDKIESLFRREIPATQQMRRSEVMDKLVGMQRRSPLSLSGGKTSTTSSSGGTGTAILGSAVGGAASGVVGNLLNEVESLFRRHDEELDTLLARSEFFDINELD